jgi:hypothetical protein
MLRVKFLRIGATPTTLLAVQGKPSLLASHSIRHADYCHETQRLSQQAPSEPLPAYLSDLLGKVLEQENREARAGVAGAETPKN